MQAFSMPKLSAVSAIGLVKSIGSCHLFPQTLDETEGSNASFEQINYFDITF